MPGGQGAIGKPMGRAHSPPDDPSRNRFSTKERKMAGFRGSVGYRGGSGPVRGNSVARGGGAHEPCNAESGAGAHGSMAKTSQAAAVQTGSKPAIGLPKGAWPGHGDAMNQENRTRPMAPQRDKSGRAKPRGVLPSP